MQQTDRLLDYYRPPDGFVLESFVATTYQVNFEFFEEELLATALGVRSPVSRMRAFRSEIERQLQNTEVTVLYDLSACERLVRLSPRIDPIPVSFRKLHAKISILMWVRLDEDRPERWIRLIIGSANLTRQGFRENYECVAAIDYSARRVGPKKLLQSALTLVEQIGADSRSPQLAHQLARFDAEVNRLPNGGIEADDPIAFVEGHEVLSAMGSARKSKVRDVPKKLTIVSPFWPTGPTAVDALTEVIRQTGVPEEVELVCRGNRSADGKSWVPEFDRELASGLKNQLSSRLFLRPAVPNRGVEAAQSADPGDENEDREFDLSNSATTEEIHRPLHAKILLVDDALNSLLYVGSSNCTRQGLGVGTGEPNWEAGIIYKLDRQQRKHVESLLGFAGERMEILPDRPLKCVPPVNVENKLAPVFISAVIATGTTISIRFNSRVAIPADLRLMMEILPSRQNSRTYWLLYRRDAGTEAPMTLQIDLDTCPRCDERLQTVGETPGDEQIVPHVQIEVYWEGNVVSFPVRFDEKESLPLLLLGRKPTEGELIDYFLFGREPGDGGNGGTDTDNGTEAFVVNTVDTRRILSYFIRRFVQAIPGIETEIARAAYNQRSLLSALRGPTSPLELAERAFASLSKPASPDEPSKTPTAVAFQLVEIGAALLRSHSKVQDPELRWCFDPVIARCNELLERLTGKYQELQQETFRLYKRLLLEES